MDNILNDKNYRMYSEISKVVFGDSSYSNCMKTYSIINTFSNLLPEFLTRENVVVNGLVLITKVQRMKSREECLDDFVKGITDMYTMDVILKETDRGCIKKAKFVKAISTKLNDIIRKDTNLKKKYHETPLFK